MSDGPAFVLAHHKCATTWLAEILRAHCSENGLEFFGSLESGCPTPPNQPTDVVLYTNSLYETFLGRFGEQLPKSNGSVLHVIRNPLDIVVSAYYSHLNSHRVDRWPSLARQRETLRRLDKQAGMQATWVFLERADFHQVAVGPLFALRRWNFSDARFRTVRMEDLVGDQQVATAELRRTLGRDPSAAILRFTFEKLTGGRPKGVVDDHHHFRSGRRDQWIEEMDPSLARAIYAAYSELIDNFYPDVAQTIRAS